MKIILPTKDISGKIVEIRIDRSFSPDFSPDFIPQGITQIVLDIRQNLLKGNHILEIITEKGNYAKFTLNV
ncbi:hypothetical protein [Acidianus brierleyi]|uniref:Uncharacterized protein n=1 Tax=Acidianus brierleyi TaxID=41673 RepID=A0A2U9IBU1_9CREN|nr:hypothetical protein [Acidianus brierleyi]AWR93479.1 hypothetical protein DFR85_01490 [Acidianus brierleyi]